MHWLVGGLVHRGLVGRWLCRVGVGALVDWRIGGLGGWWEGGFVVLEGWWVGG